MQPINITERSAEVRFSQDELMFINNALVFAPDYDHLALLGVDATQLESIFQTVQNIKIESQKDENFSVLLSREQLHFLVKLTAETVRELEGELHPCTGYDESEATSLLKQIQQLHVQMENQK